MRMYLIDHIAYFTQIAAAMYCDVLDNTLWYIAPLQLIQA